MYLGIIGILFRVFILDFLAPIFFLNFSIGEILIIGKLINDIPEKVTWKVHY